MEIDVPEIDARRREIELESVSSRPRWSRKGPLCGKRGGHPRHRRLDAKESPLALIHPPDAHFYVAGSRVCLASSSSSVSAILYGRWSVTFYFIIGIFCTNDLSKTSGGVTRGEEEFFLRNRFIYALRLCILNVKVLKLRFLLSIFHIDCKFLQEANIGMRFIALKWKLKYHGMQMDEVKLCCTLR